MRDGNGEWQQQALLVAQNGDPGDEFGIAIAISDDGNTVCVGADSEDSDALGVGGDSDNNDDVDSGAVYVFGRQAGNWAQKAYLKAWNNDASWFGTSLDLSADGTHLAVGAPGGPGAVYVFQRSDFGAWSKQGEAKASNADNGDLFGGSLAISADGNRLAVGASEEASSATGVGGDPTKNDAARAGAVYVFDWDVNVWSQDVYLKASNAKAEDYFGYALALSGDGGTLAVGAYGESSNATGINGDQDNADGRGFTGAAYVFVESGSSWRQQAYVKPSEFVHCGKGVNFGTSLALSVDGNVLAIGADYECSAAVGIDGDQLNETLQSAGAEYLFWREGETWSQRAYIKAPNTDGGDRFGWAASLSDDGSALAVAAFAEDSSSTDPNDNSASEAGAVYVYEDDRRSAPSPR
jgi:hypothetical protein